MNLQERIRHLQELVYKLDNRKAKEDLTHLLNLIQTIAADTNTFIINHIDKSTKDKPHAH